MSALSAVLSTRVRRRRKFGEVSCRECTDYGNEWIDSSGKTETRNPVEGYFGSEFPAICNHCGILAVRSRKTLKCFDNFLRFLEKRPLMVNFSKFCSKSFHRDTDRRVVFKFRKIWPTGNQWNRALFTWQKKQQFAWLSNRRHCADRAQNLRGPASDNVLRMLQNFIQLGSLSAEL